VGASGRAVEVSGIGLIFGGILLDDGETGDEGERVGLDFEPFEENVLVAAAAPAIAAGPPGEATCAGERVRQISQ
jgi:hypothetical protein